jgi:acyl carrier protein
MLINNYNIIMQIEQAKLEELVKSQIKIFCEDNDIEIDELNKETRLIGADTVLDSMGLVTFLVELEDKLEELYSIQIEIADEKAMSRHRSPFISIETLTEFLTEKINEA